MFVEFLYELRRRGVRVGPQEGVALASALMLDLHDTTLDGFYDVARAILVHREQDLDAFDTAFAVYFEGLEIEAIKITDEILEWLRQGKGDKRELTDEERQMLETLDLAEVRRRLQERLQEQKERHDRGNRWVGTRGTSPHGRGGTHPSGVTVGDGPGGKSALARACAHNFRALRGDINIDVRQIELALRRLRAFVREGALSELDIDGTIDATAKNAGELEVVLRPERRPNLKLILLLDVGGSMDPHIQLCERLFTAAKNARHWKQLEVYYFHNCIYGWVYPTTSFRNGVSVADLVRRCDPSWRLIFVGDALMHPAELTQGAGSWSFEEWTDMPGIAWMDMLARHFRKTAWLNPEPEHYWRGTAATLRALFPMFRLSLDGLNQAVAHLTDRARLRVGAR